jgi:hypothetical protein
MEQDSGVSRVLGQRVLGAMEDKRSYCSSNYVLGSDRAQQLEEQKENEWVTLPSIPGP